MGSAPSGKCGQQYGTRSARSSPLPLKINQAVTVAGAEEMLEFCSNSEMFQGGPAMGRSKGSIFDSVIMLAIMGILAGAIGGFGIGLMTSRSSSSSSSSAVK